MEKEAGLAGEGSWGKGERDERGLCFFSCNVSQFVTERLSQNLVWCILGDEQIHFVESSQFWILGFFFAVRFFFCCWFIKVLAAEGVVFFRPSIFLSFIPAFSPLPLFAFFWAAPDSGRARRSIGVSSRSPHCAQSAHSLSVVLVLVLLLDSVFTFPYVPSLHFFYPSFLSPATCEYPFDR